MKSTFVGLFLAGLLLVGCSKKSEKPFITEKIPTVNRTYKGAGDNNSTNYLNVYTEEGRWFVVGIKKESGKIQEPVFQKNFFTQAEVDSFVANYIQEHDLAEQLELGESGKFVTEVPQNEVWPAKNQWSWEWEEKYAEWFKKEVDPDFFKKNNLLVDCADVAYALRWIFSRINYLPAAAQLSGTKDLFTNESVKEIWKDLPTDNEWQKDKKFMAALEFVLVSTYTHTLKLELYPIAINLTALTRGVVNLSIFVDTGHTLNVIKVEEDGLSVPITTMWSSVPRMLYLSSGAYFQSQQPDGKDGVGFGRFRWPVKEGNSWKLVEAEKMPHYSREQYDPEFMNGQTNFTVAVLKKLFPNFDLKKLFEGGIQLNKNSLKKRAELVVEGYEFCKKNDCAPGTAGWEDYSTPNRDRQIRERMRDLEKFAYELRNHYYDDTGKQEKIWEVWTKSWDDVVLNYKGKDITMKEINYIWTAGGYNVDPRVTPEERWGIEPASFVSNIMIKLNDVVAKRLEKISKNVCKAGTCEPLSDLWKAHNTYKEDGELQYIDYTLARYCRYLGQERCKEYEELKTKREIKVNNSDVKLGDFLSSTLWLNSDPRWEDSVRWGGFEKKWMHVKFKPGLTGYRTKDFLVQQSAEKGPAWITDLTNNKSVPWASEFQYVDYNAKTQRLIGRNQNQFRVLDVVSQTYVDFEHENVEKYPARWVGPNLILIQSDDFNFELISVNGQKANSLGKYKSRLFIGTKELDINNPADVAIGGEHFGPTKWWPIDEGNGVISVLDMENPTSSRTYFKPELNADEKANGVFITGDAPKAFMTSISIQKCKNEKCEYFKNLNLLVDKTTGKYKETPNSYTKLQYPYVAISEKNGMAVYKVDENLTLLQKVKDFAGAKIIWKKIDHVFETYDGLQSTDVFRINSDDTIIDFPRRGRSVWKVTEDGMAVTFDKEYAAQIQDWTGKKLFEMQHVTPTYPQGGGYSPNLKVFFANPEKLNQSFWGLYALGKYDERPIMTGMGLQLITRQNNYSGEFPVFHGFEFEDLTHLLQDNWYQRPIAKEEPFSYLWNDAGFALFRHKDEAIWFSPELPK